MQTAGQECDSKDLEGLTSTSKKPSELVPAAAGV